MMMEFYSFFDDCLFSLDLNSNQFGGYYIQFSLNFLGYFHYLIFLVLSDQKFVFYCGYHDIFGFSVINYDLYQDASGAFVVVDDSRTAVIVAIHNGFAYTFNQEL